MATLSEINERARELDRAADFLRFVQLSAKYSNPKEGWKAIAESERLHGAAARPTLMLKTAVAGMTTQTDSALVPDRVATSAWMSVYSRYRLAGRIPFPKAPFNSKTIAEILSGSGTWVAEGAAIPVSKFSLDEATLDRTKISGIFAVSSETVQSDRPENLQRINQAMIAGVGRFEDRALLDPDIAAVAGKNPASLTSGISATLSTGSTEATITANVKTMLQEQVDAGADLSDVVICMHPMTALHMSTLLTAGNIRAYPNLGVRGGEVFGIPVLTSVGAVCSGSPSERVLAVINPAACLLADEGDVQIAASTLASIQLDDAPTNNLDGTATSSVSMFQTNAVAIRFSRYINFIRGVSGAVRYMRVTY